MVANSDPSFVDAAAKAIADKCRTAVAPIANAVVGSITADITRTANPAGESPLGDVIADGMSAYTQSAGAQIAFMNPGGIRGDLSYALSPGGEAATRFLQVSAGFAYTYDSTRLAGDRIVAMTLNGSPIDPAATHRVSTNDFVANGGDGFTSFGVATDRTTAPGFDVDALAAHLAAGPVAPGPADRITKIG